MADATAAPANPLLSVADVINAANDREVVLRRDLATVRTQYATLLREHQSVQRTARAELRALHERVLRFGLRLDEDEDGGEEEAGEQQKQNQLPQQQQQQQKQDVAASTATDGLTATDSAAVGWKAAGDEETSEEESKQLSVADAGTRPPPPPQQRQQQRAPLTALQTERLRHGRAQSVAWFQAELAIRDAALAAAEQRAQVHAAEQETHQKMVAQLEQRLEAAESAAAAVGPLEAALAAAKAAQAKVAADRNSFKRKLDSLQKDTRKVSE
jgi:hypothetical protein